MGTVTVIVVVCGSVCFHAFQSMVNMFYVLGIPHSNSKKHHRCIPLHTIHTVQSIQTLRSIKTLSVDRGGGVLKIGDFQRFENLATVEPSLLYGLTS